MKKLFVAIRQKDNELVKSIIEKNPKLVNCTAKAPPKKDDGQSPLQIAFKCGNFWAADFLLQSGADVNFMEKSEINEWRTPVLHDCIRACIAHARWEIQPDPWANPGKYIVRNSQQNFEKLFGLLKFMLQSGADPKKLDSYGNDSIYRLCLDTNYFSFDRYRALAQETKQDLKKIFDILVDFGADINYEKENRGSIIKNFGLALYQLGVDFETKKYQIVDSLGNNIFSTNTKDIRNFLAKNIQEFEKGNGKASIVLENNDYLIFFKREDGFYFLSSDFATPKFGEKNEGYFSHYINGEKIIFPINAGCTQPRAFEIMRYFIESGFLAKNVDWEKCDTETK